MKKALKKLIVAALTFAICLLPLTGCEKKQDENTLTIGLHLGGYGQKWLEDIAARFEEDNPGITVDIEAEANLTDTFHYKLETETEIKDIFFGLEVVNVKGWAARGWIEPLDDLYAMEAENGVTVGDKIIDDYARFSEVTSRFGTHQYAIPWNDGASGLFYNAALFREHDIRIPTVVDNAACLKAASNEHGSKSWVDGEAVGLVQVCEYINALRINRDSNKDNDVAPFVWGGRIVSYWDFLVKNWWVQLIGVDAFNNFYKMESVNSIDPSLSPMKELKKAVETLDKLVFKAPENSMADCQSKDHTLAQMDFTNRKAAMMCNGPWFESEANAIDAEGFEMMLMPTPFIDGAKQENGKYVAVNNTVAADYAFIPAAAQNKELAKKFLAYMCKDEMLQIYTSKAGTVRPFEYVPQTDGLTNCQKSIIDIWQNSKNFYVVSPTTMSILQHATPFMMEMPYNVLSAGTGYNVEEFFNKNYQFAKENWDRWLAEA